MHAAKRIVVCILSVSRRHCRTQSDLNAPSERGWRQSVFAAARSNAKSNAKVSKVSETNRRVGENGCRRVCLNRLFALCLQQRQVNAERASSIFSSITIVVAKSFSARSRRAKSILIVNTNRIKFTNLTDKIISI